MRRLTRLAVRGLVLVAAALVAIAALLPFGARHLPEDWRREAVRVAGLAADAGREHLPDLLRDPLTTWEDLLRTPPPERAGGGPIGPLGSGPYAGYDRDDYGGWIDADRNCLNTRAEVLRELSTGPVRMRSSGCSVDSGKWFDPYTGKTFTQASALDVDHMVPLAWAHAHGAAAWPKARKVEFANWLPNLLPVDASANRGKGALPPWEWMPPRDDYKCEYLIRFQRIALQWDLEFRADEKEKMNGLASRWCD